MIGIRKRTIRNPMDFAGGLALVAVAGFAWYAASDLDGGVAVEFGAGTAPRLFIMLLACLGVMIAVLACLRPGSALPHYRLRGPLIITGAIILFALLIEPLGMVLTSFLGFLVASMASRETRWLEAVVAASCLTALNIVVFVYLLSLPFRLLPNL